MSILSKTTTNSDLVPSPLAYRTLLPEGEWQDLPLLLLLHGGGGSSEYLTQMQPLFDQAWANKELPPMAVATLDAQRSFYVDFKDGSQSWETFIVTEWLTELRQTLPVGHSQDKTMIAGISMGGHGTTRIGFRYPDRFIAMAAMEPAVMPVHDFADLQPENIAFQSSEVLEERYGNPPNEYWNENNPANIVSGNAGAILSSGINIYLEVGSDDFLKLNDGTEFLHQVLLHNHIRHEYRLVLGANHVGNTVAPRFTDLLGFLARVLAGPQPDPMLDQILANLGTEG